MSLSNDKLWDHICLFRGQEWHTVSQYVSLSVNSTYYFECWVKPLNISSGQKYMTGQLVAHMESESSK